MKYIVVIIKPHAVVNRIPIIQSLRDSGFRIISQRYVEINIDEAWYLCKGTTGKVADADAKAESVPQSLLGTAIVLLLAHSRALELMVEILGPEDPIEARKSSPKSLRARFGDMAQYNVIMASESPSMVIKNVQHFFPRFSDLLNGPTSNINEERIEIDEYFREKMFPTLLDAFYDICVAKPADPVVYLSQFLLQNNPNHSKVLRPGDLSENKKT